MSLAKRQKIEAAFPHERPAEKLARRAERRRERKCWWTIPLGHRYKSDYCVYCGKFDPPSYGW